MIRSESDFGTPHGDALAAARASARSGDWASVVRLLGSLEELGRPTPERVTLLAEAFLRTVQPVAAVQVLRDTLVSLERGSDQAARRRAVNLFGMALFEIGEIAEAEHAFHHALELGQRDGDDLLVARCTNNLGMIANVRGFRLDALTLYELAIPAYQRLGHVRGLAETYHNMAISHLDLGQLYQSDECERRAIDFAHRVSYERIVALAQVGRADVALRRGDSAVARVRGRAGAMECRRLDDPAGTADALRILGAACTTLGAFGEADMALAEALALATRHANPILEADALRSRAALAAARGASDDARSDADRALMLYWHAGARAAYDTLLAWRNGL